MDTASLQELGTLASLEAPRWSGKELAAAAKRTFMLWRREQPRAAALLRAAQKVRLAGPPAPATGVVLAAQQPAANKPGLGLGRRGGLAADNVGSGGGDGGSHLAVTPPAQRPVLAADAASTLPSSAGAVPAADAVPATAAVTAGSRPDSVSLVGPTDTEQHARRKQRRSAGGKGSKTKISSTPFRPHELLLLQLTERLVRGATARLTQQALDPRSLSTLVWSLTSLGYWQPGLLPLVSAFLDYGAERMRAADPIAMAVVLQVLARAQAASAAGQPTATRLLSLAEPAAAAAADALPGRLPSCSTRTLGALLYSCASLLSPMPSWRHRHRAPGFLIRATADAQPSGPAVAVVTAAASMPEPASDVRDLRASSPGPEPAVGPASLPAPAAARVAALARDVVRECARRRFVGFGPESLVPSALALDALGRVGALGPPSGPCASGGNPGGGGGGARGSGEGIDADRAWQLLLAAAVSPIAPEMARASESQWRALLRVAGERGGSSSRQVLLTSAAAAGVKLSVRGDQDPPSAAALPDTHRT